MLFASVSYGQINEIDESGNITTRDTPGRRSGDSTGAQAEGNKEIPKGMKTWTVDEQFGDRTAVAPDTLPYMYMNTVFTEGLRGEYNTTGNKGAPRINRIFIDRPTDGHFLFTQPYDYFLTQPGDFHFTNTLSPFTNLSYNKCGDRTNGDDHFTAKFGVNAGRRLGFGFNFNYIYGRGYYDSQSTAHFNYTMYGSYLGDRYEAHLLMSTNHQKVTENGGITNDDYIVHPERFNESFQSSEIPIVLQENWNRNDNQHVFLTHRFNLGFNRKVPMTAEEIEAKKFAMASQKEEAERKEREKKEKQAMEEGRILDEDELKPEPTFAGRPDDAKVAGVEPEKSDSLDMGERIAVNGKAAADSLLAAESKEKADTSWLKNEYVPVTSFIHTLKLDNYRRIYQAYDTPNNFYASTYYPDAWLMAGDSIYDKTKLLNIKNTVAISMLEGFNKWAKAGVKVFASSDLRQFSLPDSLGAPTSYKEHSLSVGGQLSKTQGHTLHYRAKAETWLIGEDAGQLKIDASVDLNFRLFRDTVTLAARGFFYRLNPTFYYRHYHSKHLWWDNDDLDKIIHSRIEGLFSYQKTRTTLRVAVDEIKNYTYFGQSYSITESFLREGNTIGVRQSSDAISLLTASLSQQFTLGPLNWETVLTYQKATKSDVLPVPDLNVYTNLFMRFKIARVLSVDLGADARYFTKYAAPDYSPALGQFCVQEGEAKQEIGNYPIVNVYANLHLKHTRFFVMMTHVNAGSGSRDYFLTPHYPTNGRVLRLGVSWNFFN